MTIDGRTTIPLEALKARADLLAMIRQFMAERDILEVETPYLSHAYNTDPNINNLVTKFNAPNQQQPETLSLHSSPEFPMKRLLASGSGSIYQIARVFRDGEQGQLHNPEFTMLEWYRTDFDHHQLMDEIDQLLLLLNLSKAERFSYEEVFLKYTGLNPHTDSDEQIKDFTKAEGLIADNYVRTTALDFIFSYKVVPQLGKESPCFVFDYPASQAALARIKQRNEIELAERFELFISGMEIANGYNELTDANELRQRFETEQQSNMNDSYSDFPIDENLLSVMELLPDCAGVAIGIDRLLMALMGEKEIKNVISFCVNKA